MVLLVSHCDDVNCIAVFAINDRVGEAIKI